MWRCLCGWEPRKCSLEGRERKHVYIEGAFIELLPADASKSLIHFKKKCGRLSLPCRECFFLISHVVRGVSVIFLSWCCRHSESPLEKSFGLPKASMDVSPCFLCILYSQSRTYLWRGLVYHPTWQMLGSFCWISNWRLLLGLDSLGNDELISLHGRPSAWFNKLPLLYSSFFWSWTMPLHHFHSWVLMFLPHKCPTDLLSSL